MEIYSRPFNPELVEVQGKQKLYSSLYAADLKRFPEPIQYPLETIPEEDVELLQKLAIGMFPEDIGDKQVVEDRLRRMRRIGVDFYRNSSNLSPRERQFIFHFQNGTTTTKGLAEQLNTSPENIRVLRSGVEKKLGNPFKPKKKDIILRPRVTVLPNSILEFVPPRYKKEQKRLEEVRDELVEIREYHDAMAVAGGV